MNLYLISKPFFFSGESKIVVELLDCANFIFHVRKPASTVSETFDFISSLPKKYHNRIVIHEHHELKEKFKLKGLHLSAHERIKFSDPEILSEKKQNSTLTLSTSFHHLSDLVMKGNYFDYVFLSPVFDSISKKDYYSNPDLTDTKAIAAAKKMIKASCKIIGLGGIVPASLDELYKLGYDGAAILGAIWEDENPLQRMLEFKNNSAQL